MVSIRTVAFSRTGNCLEIDELRRICCEESDRVRQLRIDDLSLQQERESYYCESALDSNSGFSEQGEFLVGTFSGNP